MLRATTAECRDVRQIGGDVLTDPVAEIFLLGIAAHVLECQDADRERALAATRDGLVDRRRPNQRLGAGDQLAPAGRSGVATPFTKVGALNLVERERRNGAVKRRLYQRAGGARDIGLGAYPLGFGRFGRP